MAEAVDENAQIKARTEDVTAAISAVRKELLDKPPKMPRAGRVITKELEVTVMPIYAAWLLHNLDVLLIGNEE